MNNYTVHANCRKVGAIGIFYPNSFSVQIENDKELTNSKIIDALYKKYGNEYEHFRIIHYERINDNENH